MTRLTDAERIKEGARIRREVLGAPHVERGQTEAATDPFYKHWVDFTTEHCWGTVWVRPGLSRKTRSMLNLAMLSVLARWHEFEIHLHGALNNGVTEDEIVEILLQAGVYGGVPIAGAGFGTAKRVIDEHRKTKG